MKIKKILTEDKDVFTDAEASVADKEAGRPVFKVEKVKKGDVYFLLKGDSVKEAKEALEKGAVCVFTENKNENGCFIEVSDIRKALALYSASFYGHPERKLKIIGVTGTNGKTTTANIIAHLLKKSGYKTALIGTLGAEVGEKKLSTSLTTPDPDEFFALLAEAAGSEIDYVVTEVSAHAIFFRKLYGLELEYCVFTNLSRDHLDFFESMERYGRVKKSIFCYGQVKNAVVNTDDELGREIFRDRKGRTLTYGLYNPAEVFALDCKYRKGTEFLVNAFDEIEYITTKLSGEFNLYNTLAAMTVVSDIGIPLAYIKESLLSLTPPEGRFNVLQGSGFKVIIDYAHTPDGLEKVLTAARGITENSLICVFGCGGNRDREKRPLMGETVQRLSDLCIITSDNPRDENPEDIISDILAGADRAGKSHIAIPDRKKALLFALRIAHEGDTVVIAGKGAEKYMEIKGEKIPFNDKEICEEYLGRRN